MDPRPFHFDYRKPRVNNPTFQSFHLYDSIYQLSNFNNSSQEKDIAKLSPNRYVEERGTPQSEPVPRNLSSNLKKLQKIQINRHQSKDQFESRGRAYSNLSEYGTNLLQGGIDQNSIYKKQQRNFNIISCYPNSWSSNLKQYPKLTLQDKINDFKSSGKRTSHQNYP